MSIRYQKVESFDTEEESFSLEIDDGQAAMPSVRQDLSTCLVGCNRVPFWFLLLLVTAQASWLITSSTHDHATKVTLESSEDISPKGFVHGDTVYAHVHMAKTAGTEINGMLSLMYERVCGHKGYSYDAVGFYNRLENGNTHDIYGDHNRGWVPFPFVHEIGFEDCDWVSDEEPFGSWAPELVHQVEPYKVEFHSMYGSVNLNCGCGCLLIDPFLFSPHWMPVPCREPINHLMSQCNFMNRKFNCTNDMEKEIRKCLLLMHRFDEHGLLKKLPNATMKCFDPIPVDNYLDYMGKQLQARKITRPYIHRASNKPRDKEHECLLHDSSLQEKVKDWLVRNIPYYAYCNECLGSEDDLFPDKS